MDLLKKNFSSDGYLVLKQFLTDKTNNLLDMLEEVISPKDFNIPTVYYFEKMNSDTQLCRVENFCTSFKKWQKLESNIRQFVSDIVDEQVYLFKDKINIKPSGGAGFKAHQDITAFLATKNEFPKYHISVCIPLKKFTIKNGCLEVATNYYSSQSDTILPHTNGVLLPSVEESLKFVPILADVGDIILFNSFVPHRAGHNNTEFSREAVFLTYNKKTEGNHREHYYAQRNQNVVQGAISINQDFAGISVGYKTAKDLTKDTNDKLLKSNL